ncbi:MAG: hypothetical protein EOL87_12450 [Spartobacteria bacterium]|nr:hypothetical protein [Spartobacteria bacterium]
MVYRCLLIGFLYFFSHMTVQAMTDWGPVYADYTNIIGEHVTSAAGPVYQHIETTEEQPEYTGVRPIYSHIDDPAQHRRQTTWLWPVASVTKTGYEKKWRILCAWGRSNSVTGDKPGTYRIRIFPVYFQSRGMDGKTSVAVFPLGGTIKDVYFFDEATFFLFPLWSRWRVNDFTTTNWLWPFMSSSDSPDGHHEKHRFFPFYAHSLTKDLSEKWAVMWPFWVYNKYYPKGAAGYSYVLWPLFGRVHREDQEGWMFLPPLIRFNFGKDGTLINCPWPFIHYRRENGMKAFRIWPLFGTRTLGRKVDTYMAWPLIWSRSWIQNDRAKRFFQVVPFLVMEETRNVVNYSPDRDKVELGDVTSKATKLWPLFHYRREGKVRQIRALDLWPFYNGREVIAGSWGPYWTLLTHTVVADEGYETEALWGMYRRQRIRDEKSHTSVFPLFDWDCDRHGGGKKEWSILKGLFGYKREDGIRRYRFLYFFECGGRKETQP